MYVFNKHQKHFIEYLCRCHSGALGHMLKTVSNVMDQYDDLTSKDQMTVSSSFTCAIQINFFLFVVANHSAYYAFSIQRNSYNTHYRQTHPQDMENPHT